MRNISSTDGEDIGPVPPETAEAMVSACLRISLERAAALREIRDRLVEGDEATAVRLMREYFGLQTGDSTHGTH